MRLLSAKKQRVFDLLIIASIFAAVAITAVSLTSGVYEVFPYFYLIPIVLAAYSRPKWSIYGTVLVGWLYLAMVFLIGLPEPRQYILAIVWFYVFVSIGVLISMYSRVYCLEGEKTCAAYYNSQAGAFSFDKQTLRITDVNRKFAGILGFDKPELLRKSLPELMPGGPAREQFLANLHDLRRIGNIEASFLSADAKILWTLVSAIETPSPDIICTVVDITEHKQAQEALKLANKKLNLLNNITRHDILNQLTALTGYIQLSKEYVTDPDVIRFIEKEEQTADAIKSQIVFARDYQNIGVHSPEWHNVTETISLAMATIDPGHIRVEMTLSPVEIYADPLLEKVFYNLIENSVRHGENATVITISSSSGENGLDLTLSDNGKGIPEAEKEKIFRREYFKNTGFGLFLSREILAITGLTIREEGVPGSGACFIIHAPPESFRLVRE